MSITAGTLSKTLVGQSTAQLTATAATGATGTVTQQWYRSTTNDFTPGAGNIISGATALTLNDSGLIPGTTYYYVVAYTDSSGPTTVDSTQLTVQMESGQSQNQFAQSPVIGVVDLLVGPTNVVSAQADQSLGLGTIQPGQAVKLVSNSNGGVPKVVPVTSKSDVVFGVCVFNFKDIQYFAGQNLEVAIGGTVIWQWATGAITQGTQVCLDQTYVGGVQATGNSATVMGFAVDGAASAGPIRVHLQLNPAGTTA